MSNKNIEMMKKFLAKKNEMQNEKQTYEPNKKIGGSQRNKNNRKTGGSNNKV